MNTSEIYKHLCKEIGEIDPTGEENIDEDRLENFEKYCKIFLKMGRKIKEIKDTYLDSYYHSEQVIGQKAKETLDEYKNEI